MFLVQGKTTTPLVLSLSSLAILVVGAGIFALMAWLGIKLSDHISTKEEAVTNRSVAEDGLESTNETEIESNPTITHQVDLEASVMTLLQGTLFVFKGPDPALQ